MKALLFLHLFIFTSGFTQELNLNGKWFVESKQAKSDLDIPEKLILVRDSMRFNSIEDSMTCFEYFQFELNKVFYNAGECNAIDPNKRSFLYYGSTGAWLLEKHVLHIDYLSGYHITYCEFKFKYKNNKLYLKRIKKKRVEIIPENE